ncbi:DUF262 domain-containing protein [Shewanella seohaensis]|uniref:DUF262 domain-containing protein n=1 Tax=Shewanella seohaensis TaxID=755175 RepID=A0ABV4VXF7_9GAMM
MKSNTSVHPSVLYVDDLIPKVEKGALKIPAFQRSYVWQKKNVLELFESIYHGFPIGSVLLWETNTRIKESNNFNISVTSNPFQYILDGQQRLTTLYHCLTKHSGEDGIWDVYMDLEQETFIHLTNVNEFKSTYFPISKVLNTLDFFKEAKRLLDETGSEVYVSKAEQLASRIRKYKLAMINLEGGDLDDAIEIFTRLNKTGMKIEAIDLITALNFENQDISRFETVKNKIFNITTDYDFLSQEKSDEYFGDIFIKIIRISLGFQIYANNDTEKVATLVRSDSFNDIAEKMVDSYRKTIEFIVKDSRFSSQQELPYVNILFMVFAYFFGGNSNKIVLKSMIYKGAIAGLFNVSPSGTDNLIKFFQNDFDSIFLTKKMIQMLESDFVNRYLSEIEGGTFNARSALGKVTFNIIKCNYLDGNSDSNYEFLKFPPATSVTNSNYKERLGNKCFFTSTQHELASKIYPNPLGDIESTLKNREYALYSLIQKFIDDNIDVF